MTEAVRVSPDSCVLEVGTGSGYQAAILAEIARQVFSLERIPKLARDAEARLARLGYDNVRVRLADGYDGWAAEGPFDGIVVTCAAPHVPAPLIAQLRTGARLVIPVGPEHGHQELLVVTRVADGAVARTPICGVRFVPLIRGSGAEGGSASATA
jgi:protein-L-isoaspartate(D-aspartate) O-methyltransferase